MNHDLNKFLTGQERNLMKPKLVTMKTYTLSAALAIIAIITTTKTVNAQKTYLDVNFGYGFGANGTTGILYNTSSYETDINYSEKTENVKLSLGKGLNFGANFGYMFNEHVGIDLGVNYHLGSKTTGTSIEDISYYDGWSGTYFEGYSKTEESYSSNMIQVIPSLVLAQKFETITLYSKFGVVMGMGSVTQEYLQKGHYDQIEESFKVINKQSGGFTAGFSASLGTEFHLNEKLSLIGEINYAGLNYSPTKGSFTTIEENGEDISHQFDNDFLNYELVDEVSYSSSSPGSGPSQHLKTAYSYSSIGLKFGVRFKL